MRAVRHRRLLPQALAAVVSIAIVWRSMLWNDDSYQQHPVVPVAMETSASGSPAGSRSSDEHHVSAAVVGTVSTARQQGEARTERAVTGTSGCARLSGMRPLLWSPAEAAEWMTCREPKLADSARHALRSGLSGAPTLHPRASFTRCDEALCAYRRAAIPRGKRGGGGVCAGRAARAASALRGGAGGGAGAGGQALGDAGERGCCTAGQAEMCVRACVRACVRMCVRACVRRKGLR
jgi:hypothetical protein